MLHLKIWLNLILFTAALTRLIISVVGSIAFDYRVNFIFAFLSHLKVSDLLNEWTFLNAKPR